MRLGKIIQGQMDQYNRGVIFTEAFVQRHKARIRGLFSAVTRYAPILSCVCLGPSELQFPSLPPFLSLSLLSLSICLSLNFK